MSVIKPVDFIQRAAERIVEKAYDEAYIAAKRARRKLGKLGPTERQASLLHYIRRHRQIAFDETMGMDWRYLGGLFTRGLIEWHREGGVVYVRATGSFLRESVKVVTLRPKDRKKDEERPIAP